MGLEALGGAKLPAFEGAGPEEIGLPQFICKEQSYVLSVVIVRKMTYAKFSFWGETKRNMNRTHILMERIVSYWRRSTVVRRRCGK